MIYEKDGIYYINKGNCYYVVDIVLKEHTIVVTPTSKSVFTLHGAKPYTYRELKKKFDK